MSATLYGLAPSHPAVAARLMLERCGVEHRVRDLPPGLHAPLVRAAGFPRWTVPALRLDDRRIQGSMEIARELHGRAPDAGLYPAGEAERRAVEKAERWGHDELQPLARRVFRWVGARSGDVRAWVAGEVMGLPVPRVFGAQFTPVMAFFARRVSGADDATVRADLGRLPGMLERADTLLGEGVLGETGEPNAAGLQILTSVRVLLAHEDLRPILEGRPCGEAALRLLPEYPRPGAGALPPVPAALPPEWLPPTARSG